MNTPDLFGIRAVVFDAVGTLIFADPPAHMAYHRIGRRFGSSVTPQEALQRFREAVRLPVADDPLVVTEQSEREFWKRTVACVLPDVAQPDACFAELHDHFAQPAAWGCYIDVPETLAVLGQRGLRLAIASNFDSRLHQVCAGHPALASISKRIISSEIGWKKPSSRFFAAVIEACGVEPHEILMIGDDLESDIEPAIEAGLSALHLDRSGGSLFAIASLEPLADAAGLPTRSKPRPSMKERSE